MLKHYIEEMFEPTLLYSFSLAVLGVAVAAYYGHYSILYGTLAIIGSVLAQMSVNVISDYFDYSSGLDKELGLKKKGNLSGGSSLIAKGLIKPEKTLLLGLLVFLIAVAIGVYLVLVRIQILPIVIIAALTILLYARYVKRVPYLAEPLCTINYTLIAVGSFVVTSGTFGTYAWLFSLIPAGIILGGNALYVNEVPDQKVDRRYGVRHSAVMLGTSKRIGAYYLAWQSLAYAILIMGVALAFTPMLAILSIITFPTTIYVYNILARAKSRQYGDALIIHTVSAIIFAMILAVVYVM